MTDTTAGAGFGLFFVFMMLLGLGGLVFWIIALVDCIRRPEDVYRVAGSEKVTWVLIVALAGWIGGLIYWFSQRGRLVEIERSGAAAFAPTYVAPHPGHAGAPMYVAPPGWYPDPQGGGLRWWDGRQWTHHVSDRPEP